MGRKLPNINCIYYSNNLGRFNIGNCSKKCKLLRDNNFCEQQIIHTKPLPPPSPPKKKSNRNYNL